MPDDERARAPRMDHRELTPDGGGPAAVPSFASLWTTRHETLAPGPGQNERKEDDPMRLIPIKDLLAMEEEEAVPAFRGTIKRVFGRSTGENEHGSYSIQNLVVVDPGNDKVELKVKLKDQEEVPEKAKGRSLYVESNRGDRGMTGIKIKVETYQGKQRKFANVTKTATVTLLDRNAPTPSSTPAPETGERPPVGSPEEQGEAPAAPQRPAAPATSAPASASPPPPSKPADGKPKRDPKQHEAELVLIQQANLWRRCLAVMHKTAEAYAAATGEKLDGETIRSGTSTLFIQGARDGLYRSMPKELLPFKPHPKGSSA